MTNRLDVSLVVTSRNLSLPDLAAKLERGPEDGSHDKGDLRGRDSVWQFTVWRQNSPDNSAAWHERCLWLLREMPPKCTEILAANQDDIAVSLEVAVFFEAACCGVALRRELIAELFKKGVDIEITAYPVSDSGVPSTPDPWGTGKGHRKGEIADSR